MALSTRSSLFVELFNTYNVATNRLVPAPSGAWGEEASAVRMDTVYMTGIDLADISRQAAML